MRLGCFDHDLRFEIGFASEKGKRADNQDYAAARLPQLDDFPEIHAPGTPS
ncbi:hypothetical protein GJ654_13645 [Rhodoblastus acidophilus]|uniref:Uncharacterized protein n=1 Tax=Rhodoblastus acidophilus TaxID=1074 RepID=A0A6N8DNA7_RHOAC|nr:hypothetical protein [Rhodoblastus acidophilus]MCW2275529.1 hypothetical protein [Rhodoblastus acidophilus]MTV32030.1 hypothetical protein [Rhodoblastus acidophilus]